MPISPTIAGAIPEYLMDKVKQLVKEKKFRNKSDFVAYAVRFYLDYLERRDFNYAQELPDELAEKEAKR